MLSRIMRHPAGLMRKALSRKFLTDAFRRQVPQPAPPPDYWLNRYSNVGMALIAAAPVILHPAPVALVHSIRTEDRLLPAQGGKASSFLAVARPKQAAESTPDTRP